MKGGSLKPTRGAGPSRARVARRRAARIAVDESFPFAEELTDHGRLTALGCPDCRGVLRVSARGPGRFLSFRCQVGHVFSVESLVLLKDDELESAFWTAIELCDEVASLREHMVESTPATERATRERHRAQARRAREHGAAVRALVTGASSDGKPRSRRS